MPEVLDNTLLFGVVALESERISKDDFLSAAAAVHESGGTIRDTLISRHEIPPQTVQEIDAKVAKRLALKDTLDVRKKMAEEDSAAASEDEFKVDERYSVEAELGRGGLGVVKLVKDSSTKRKIAYKTLRMPGKSTAKLEIADIDQETIERFREEALVCAQLEHPNIVPVYELGKDSRGLPFYTMRAIDGKTLTLSVAEYHNKRMLAGIKPSEAAREELALMRSRLYHTFADVCKAIAYSHAKGVIHRDLKSDNIMLGAYGETILLDWGIAKVKGTAVELDNPREEPANTQISGKISTIRENVMLTIDGSIMGTPSYMSPEQAQGENNKIDELSDVYSLGAMLYEIIVGVPPFFSDDIFATLDMVLMMPPIAPGLHLALRDARFQAKLPLEGYFPTREEYLAGEDLPQDRLAVPHELERIALRCLAKVREKRVPSAKDLYDAILNFLEGSQYQAQQQSLCAEALSAGNEACELYYRTRESILTLEVEEAALRQRTPSFAKVSSKQELWRLEDKLASARSDVKTYYNRAVAKLTEANGYDPENHSARSAIATFFWDHLIEAEARGDSDEAQFCEARVRQYDTGEFEAGLAGNGTLSLKLEDPEAEIWCFRYHDDGRRSIPVPHEIWDMRDACVPLERPDGTIDLGNEMHADFARIGEGSVTNFELAMGSYLLLIRRRGHEDWRLPMQIRRSEHLNFEPRLPEVTAVTPGFIYIPSSRFIYGGDSRSNNVFQELLENDAFAISRFPVTAAEYWEFLQSLEFSECASRQPREGHTNTALWEFDKTGRIQIPLGWDIDAPVVGVSWEDAMAYASWLSAKEGRTYTLPTEAQWEHSARGADGRYFPWGNGVDATFLNCAGSREEGNGLVSVDSYPSDESPFGVRGLGGNVRDWCMDNPGSRRKDLRIVRGGYWSNPASYARAASRPAFNQQDTSWEVGFRLVQVLELASDH